VPSRRQVQHAHHKLGSGLRFLLGLAEELRNRRVDRFDRREIEQFGQMQ
jgi:hypothetical protein